MKNKIIETKQDFLAYLNQFNVVPKYDLGQNFLYNETYLSRIMDEIYPDGFHHVLEIGTGAASLSRVLAKRAKSLVTIEIDNSLQEIIADLSRKFPNVQGIVTDATTLDLSFLFTEEEKDDLHIVANLPYYITSDLISQCIVELPQAQSLLFLVQEDAVPRICGREGDGKSKSKNQGWLNKFITCYGDIRAMHKVSRDKFYPSPHVDSQFILVEKSMKRKQVLFLERHGHLLLHTIKLAFSQRRKTLVNSFEQVGLKSSVARWLEQEDMSASIRAEELESEDFMSLTRFLFL